MGSGVRKGGHPTPLGNGDTESAPDSPPSHSPSLLLTTKKLHSYLATVPLLAY